MKNIFKKNQIIIVALAIMIIIAGYLNYSGKNNSDKANNVADFKSGEVLDYNTNKDTAKDNALDSDLVSLLDNEDAVVDENAQTADGTTDKTDVAAADGEDAKAVEAEVDGKKADDTADNSTKDGEQLAVSDTGEVVVDDKNADTPGEAVLVSTTIPANFFATAKLTREQMRAKNRETFTEIINNVNSTKEDKAKATDALINQTAIIEKEYKTETLLEARGFTDAVVTISDNSVEVIINATSISNQDIAQIEDVVTRNTEVDVSKVVINPVVKEE